MLSHKDLTIGELSVKSTIVSIGIFLKAVSFWSICFRKQISAISRKLTKSLEGVTRPPLVRAEM